MCECVSVRDGLVCIIYLLFNEVPENSSFNTSAPTAVPPTGVGSLAATTLHNSKNINKMVGWLVVCLLLLFVCLFPTPLVTAWFLKKEKGW